MNKCKYKNKCEHYRKDSYTCNKGNKYYCGEYRDLRLKKVFNKNLLILTLFLTFILTLELMLILYLLIFN